MSAQRDQRYLTMAEIAYGHAADTCATARVALHRAKTPMTRGEFAVSHQMSHDRAFPGQADLSAMGVPAKI